MDLSLNKLRELLKNYVARKKNTQNLINLNKVLIVATEE